LGELRGSDLRVVAEQLGRRPTITFTVVARCPGGHPLAIRNAPVDEQGNPFPTLFWLTCPDAVRAVSRLEADGWISKLNERIETDPEFADAVARAHADYARERARQADDHGVRVCRGRGYRGEVGRALAGCMAGNPAEALFPMTGGG
jgi:hypothetical protein